MFSGTKLTLMLVCLSVSALLSVRTDEKEPAINRLLSDNPSIVKEAQDELLAARADLISALIGIVENEESLRTRWASVQAAMFILGEMRTIEGFQALLAHIAFPDVVPVGSEARPGPPVGTHRLYTLSSLRSAAPQVWPAVEALIKVGEPCLPEVVTKLSTTDNVVEQHACLGVLLGLRDHSSVEAMVEDAMATETDLKKQARLQSGLNILSQVE